MNNVTLLDWDTRLLGISTAKILPENLTTDELAAILNDLRQREVRLVFWCAAATTENQTAAQKFDGILVDHKLTYICDLPAMTATKNPAKISDKIAFYPQADPDQKLLNLAYEIGKYSRFCQDPSLSENQFKAIYAEWMTNSTYHRNAMDVMVIPDLQGWAGMVTLGEKNQRGDIGLLAVAPHARGKGYGKILVESAQAYFAEKGFQQSQVVTQQENIPACKLYESCGYQLEKLEYFYHFWI